MTRTKISPNIKENIGQNIKHLLEVNELRQIDFATMVGLSPAQISRLINGKSGISLDTLQDVANAFGVSVDSIMGSRKEI